MQRIATFLCAIVLVALAGLGGAAGHYLDRDAGGYVDSFTTSARFPDKFVHALAGGWLMFAFYPVLGPEWSLGAVAIAGASFELGQGYASWRDFVADMAGAIISGAWLMWVASW